MAGVHHPGWRDGKPRIITQGIFDGDAVVYELFPMQTVVFDGTDTANQMIPMPMFDTSEHARGVISLMAKSRTGFSIGTQLQVFIQNAFRSPDDPTLVFADDDTSLSIPSTVALPRLTTATFTPVGPAARIRLAWDQGPATGPCSATFAVWLTLRRA